MLHETNAWRGVSLPATGTAGGWGVGAGSSFRPRRWVLGFEGEFEQEDEDDQTTRKDE
ncbi:MAG: hypothetical protein K1X78_27655 [Verrucomicrobiaceae bacterium]|nr:hypothetical protein [Verrucomicrobiaceae bacterium]